MKLQNLTVIFIIIIIPVILLISIYISTGLKTITNQSLYDEGLLNATHDAIYAFELNTANDEYSDNPEVKRDILKSSIKMFEKSLCNTCNISSYNTSEIENHIPAIVFGMYDGFYMYAPSVRNDDTGKKEYSHSLKNYVYYSEILEGIGEDNTDVVIRYSLDNYVVVSGDFEGDEGDILKKGFLINPDDWDEEKQEYKGIQITAESLNGQNNIDAINYYKEAYEFTKWFNSKIGIKLYDLKISSYNDPENENSNFVKHKREVIKEKIESVLNSSITAYSERIPGKNYKMPKLSVDDWEKIYSNISMLTFFQGKSIGLTQYNGYCVLNSTNSNEYVNPNLMYFTDGRDYYHDIRCEECSEAITLTGYKIGSFRKRKTEVIDSNGNVVYDDEGNIEYKYIYDHDELACYNCVNGQSGSNKTVKEYIESMENDVGGNKIKKAYYTSLARERYNIIKKYN